MPSTTIQRISLRIYFRKLLLAALPVLAAGAQAPPERRNYSIEGLLKPIPRYSFVAVSSTDTSFHAQSPIYWDGKFKFKSLQPGSYVVSVYVPRMGEFRQTYSVGPATADDKGRVKITVLISASRANRLITPKERFTVSASKLFIPEKAYKEYREAQKKLRKRDIEEATKHLEKAIELAPKFAGAWNALGTIAYSQREFDLAESRFREARKLDPESYEPVLNLGGVLLNKGKFQEALPLNQDAVARRPKDALANAQLGTNYFGLRQMDLAVKYLRESKRLDPGHSSNPQLLLSEIYLRRGDRTPAAAELEDFLKHHPDHPQAEQIRATTKKLREPAAAVQQ